MVLPEEAQEFLEKLPIEKFHGVGKKSVERLHDMDIYIGADLLKIPEITLIDRFGRFGFDLFRKARGISNSPVKPNRVRKSIGSERTYGKLLYNCYQGSLFGLFNPNQTYDLGQIDPGL